MKTAEEILNTYFPVYRDDELDVDYFPESTVIRAMEEYAQQFYTSDKLNSEPQK